MTMYFSIFEKLKINETVEAKQVVAETFMPGDVIPINISNLLSLLPYHILLHLQN